METPVDLVKTIEGLDMGQKVAILKYLINLRVRVHEHSDGTRINLSTLTTEDYNKLVIFTKSIMVDIEPEFKIE